MKVLADVNMNGKDSSASRGNMITLLYGARGMKGVDEMPVTSDNIQLGHIYPDFEEIMYQKYETVSHFVKNTYQENSVYALNQTCHTHITTLPQKFSSDRYIIIPDYWFNGWGPVTFTVYDLQKDISTFLPMLIADKNIRNATINYSLKRNRRGRECREYTLFCSSDEDCNLQKQQLQKLCDESEQRWDYLYYFGDEQISFLSATKTDIFLNAELAARKVFEIGTDYNQNGGYSCRTKETAWWLGNYLTGVHQVLQTSTINAPIIWDRESYTAGSIPYKKWLIEISICVTCSNISFAYTAIDKDAIYWITTYGDTFSFQYIPLSDDDTYYAWWLISNLKKNNGQYPRLKYFWAGEHDLYKPEGLENYFQNLFNGKETSATFTTQLNAFKAEIDKLYQ